MGQELSMIAKGVNPPILPNWCNKRAPAGRLVSTIYAAFDDQARIDPVLFPVCKLVSIPRMCCTFLHQETFP